LLTDRDRLPDFATGLGVREVAVFRSLRGRGSFHRGDGPAPQLELVPQLRRLPERWPCFVPYAEEGRFTGEMVLVMNWGCNVTRGTEVTGVVSQGRWFW
jgi:hypothetical protein